MGIDGKLQLVLGYVSLVDSMGFEYCDFCMVLINIVNVEDGIFLGKFLENYNLEFDSLKRLGFGIVIF